MKSYLIETSVIIEYLKKKIEAKQLIDLIRGDLVSSYFCLAELYEGIYRVRDPKTHESEVLTIFNSFKLIYGLDINIAKKFGELRANLKKQGKIIEDFDLLLAATCIVNDLEMVTFNTKHFSHVEELKIYQPQ